MSNRATLLEIFTEKQLELIDLALSSALSNGIFNNMDDYNEALVVNDIIFNSTL